MDRDLSGNRVLLVFVVLAVLAVAVIYFLNVGGKPTIIYATSTTLIPSTSTTSSTSTTTSTSTTLFSGLSSTTQTTQTTQTTTTTVTTTSGTTSTTLPAYLKKFAGKGYHVAYMDINFFCPSCVAAVAANLNNRNGVVAKSIGYRQKISWVIYDPKRVSLEDVLMLAGGSGEMVLLSDMEI